MIAVSHRMTTCDFLLLGCSIALTVFMLWPELPDQQWVRVETETGHPQRYSVPINDPRLQVLKQRLAKWEVPQTTRALRVARWHHELADYYCQLDPADQSGDVAQVSFQDSGETSVATKPSFWAKLRQTAKQRVIHEEQEISHRQQHATPPVVLGPIMTSIRSPTALPLALMAALVTVTLAVWRQRAQPPRLLSDKVDQPDGPARNQVMPLPIDESWVRIGQPVEVRLWRITYATAVTVACICVMITKLA